jgi:hypothetical protein
MRIVERRPVAAAVVFGGVHCALSIAGYCLTVMLAIGFMDSGGAAPPLWLRATIVLELCLLQPVAYWILAAGASLATWADLARVTAVCALNSAIVTGIAVAIFRFLCARRA